MATTNLTFNEDVSKRYATTFTSTGKCTIQLIRQEYSPILVYARIPELDFVLIQILENKYQASNIFEVDVQEGIEVKVVSHTPVNTAVLYYV